MIAATAAHVRWLRPLAAPLLNVVSPVLPAVAALGMTGVAGVLTSCAVAASRAGVRQAGRHRHSRAAHGHAGR